MIGRSVRPKSTPRGVVDEKPQSAQHAGWSLDLWTRHPPAKNRLFDGAPDLRFVEVFD